MEIFHSHNVNPVELPGNLAKSDDPAYQSQVLPDPKTMDMLVLGSVLVALNITKL